MLGDFFKNIFGSDIKDINNTGSDTDRDVDKILKEHTKKKSILGQAMGGIKKGMKESQMRRADVKSTKNEDYGSTTTDDISKARRASGYKWIWKALGLTILIILITAFFHVLNMENPSPVAKKSNSELLDGIQTEDADYFQSRTSAQIASIAGELEKIKEESKNNVDAAKEALLLEAEKNKKLQEELDALKTKEKEAQKINAQETIMAMVNEKIQSLKDAISSKERRPSPEETSHKIEPMPSKNSDDIFVEPEEIESPKVEPSANTLTTEEKKVAKKKLEDDVEALAVEQTYEDIAIENLAVDDALKNAEQGASDEKKPSLHLMTGFASAVLITGVDAPTFEAGKSNPVPVVLSLTSNQIVANGFDANINDCMLIGQSHGNMITRRAEIEVTRISCNMQKDGVLHKIEKDISAWVYDENGIHGLQGRLVDSSGKILTGEMMVGFAQGVATAFTTPNTTVQNVGGIPSQLFTENNTKDAAYRGLGQGTNTGMNGLAEYYKKLLDGAYPFISVRAGRKVTVLFKGGEDLALTPYTRVNIESDTQGNGLDETMEINVNEW